MFAMIRGYSRHSIDRRQVMKRIGLVLLAAAALAVPAANAKAAGAPTAAQFAALQNQVKTLQSQVKKLQAQVKKNTSDLGDVGNVALGTAFYQVCETAVTADAFQGTWQAVDQLATALGRPAVFGPQTAISDSNTCTPIRISRSQGVPPNASVFSALVALLGS
jgi:hypothetical protein